MWLAIQSSCMTYGKWYTVGVHWDLTTETVFSLASHGLSMASTLGLLSAPSPELRLSS